MSALFDILYREYCRARLAEMRKELLISPERHEVPEAICDANDAVGTSEASQMSGGGLAKHELAVPFGRGRQKESPAPWRTGIAHGLSLRHDVVVKQHAGSIEVDTQPGEFTEFKIILPRISATSKAGADE